MAVERAIRPTDAKRPRRPCESTGVARYVSYLDTYTARSSASGLNIGWGLPLKALRNLLEGGNDLVYCRPNVSSAYVKN